MNEVQDDKKWMNVWEYDMTWSELDWKIECVEMKLEKRENTEENPENPDITA